MTANPLLSNLADSLFRSNSLVLESRGRDALAEACAIAVRPHRHWFRRTQAEIRVKLYHLNRGPLSMSRFISNAEVTARSLTVDEDNFLIVLPLEGVARFSCNSDLLVTAPGHGAIINPYSAYEFDVAGHFDRVVLRLNRIRVEAIAASLARSDKINPVHFDINFQTMPIFWIKLLESLACIEMDSAKCAHPQLLNHLEELIIESLLLMQHNSLSESIAVGTTRAPFSQIRRAMEYMRENISAPIRMSEVARNCGLSLRGLQAGFNRDLGVSPSQWLRSERLGHVYASLTVADPLAVTVTDIAFQWGFFHLGDFAAQFRARFGEKPSDVLGKLRR